MQTFIGPVLSIYDLTFSTNLDGNFSFVRYFLHFSGLHGKLGSGKASMGLHVWKRKTEGN